MTNRCVHYMRIAEVQHVRAPKLNIIQSRHRKPIAQEHEHAHWHGCIVASLHERWHDALFKAPH
jgi:hypothetical protein